MKLIEDFMKPKKIQGLVEIILLNYPYCLSFAYASGKTLI
jgi:hypothetical protein